MPQPINKAHELLIAKREEILKSLGDRGEIQIEGRAADPLDEALAASARVTAADARDRLVKLLRRVDKALRKILGQEAEDFGYCEACDRPIPETRLNIVPWTEFCVSCQEKKERKG